MLLTAAVTAIFHMGKPLTALAMCGMVLVFSGCICMPLKQLRDFNLRNYFSKNMFFYSAYGLRHDRLHDF